MAVSVIRNFIAKQLFKQKGAISNNKAVEFSANALEQRLKNLGIDPNLITSEKELNQILAYVKQAEDRSFQQQFGSMLDRAGEVSKKGEVFDMSGKKIKDPKGIMGGTEINEQTLKEGLMKTDNPFSDLVNTPRPKTLKEREAEVLARMEKDNKEAVERIRERKRLENLEDPEDMATGGRAGFKTGLGKKFLDLLKNKKMFRSRDDVPTSVFSEKKGPITIEDMANISPNELRKIRRTQELGLYGETPEILKAGNLFDRFTKKVGSKRVIDYDRAEVILNRKLRGDETLNELLQIEYQTRPGRADGGRIGYANGTPSFEDYLKERGMIEKQQRLEQLMREYQDDLERIKVMQQKQEAKDGGRIGLKLGMTKRAFLKLMGGAGAGIAALKTGLLGFGKGAATKQVAEEVVKQSTTTPPAYFFKLVEKIKTMGDDVTKGNATQERQQITRYKDFELTEDLGTGEKTIQRIKMDPNAQYYDETLAREDYMNYKPGAGQSDEAGRVADEYTEDTGYLRTTGPDKGELHDSMDGLTDDTLKEIMEEVGEVKIKKASGGIARMLGE